MTALYTVKHFINEKYRKKLPAPIPIELFVVVLATLFSYLLDFNKRWKISIVGKIPLGMPAPRLPAFSVARILLSDAFNIAIVSFALNISMAKLFAKKYNYSISPNQELFAYGFGNFVSSWFAGFPSCVGLSRCAILEGTGGKTQLFSLVSSVVVLVVIVGIGFLFRTLPICALASIIIVALLHMLTQITQFCSILRRSKLEAVKFIFLFYFHIAVEIFRFRSLKWHTFCLIKSLNCNKFVEWQLNN